MKDRKSGNRTLQTWRLKLEPPAVKLADSVAALEQGLGGGAADGDQDGGRHELDMAEDEGHAGGDLVGGRGAVARGPPED